MNNMQQGNNMFGNNQNLQQMMMNMGNNMPGGLQALQQQMMNSGQQGGLGVPSGVSGMTPAPQMNQNMAGQMPKSMNSMQNQQGPVVKDLVWLRENLEAFEAYPLSEKKNIL